MLFSLVHGVLLWRITRRLKIVLCFWVRLGVIGIACLLKTVLLILDITRTKWISLRGAYLSVLSGCLLQYMKQLAILLGGSIVICVEINQQRKATHKSNFHSTLMNVIELALLINKYSDTKYKCMKQINRFAVLI